MYSKSMYAQVRQTFLYLYSFECNLPDDDLLEAEICSRDITNDKLLLTTDCAVCWIKYCTSVWTSAMRATCPYLLIPFLRNFRIFSILKRIFAKLQSITITNIPYANSVTITQGGTNM